MTVLVKICGLTDRVAVDAAVQAGVDALGFVFAESPREVMPGYALEIAAGVPDQVLRVAVMLHPSQALWADVVHVFRPDVLQTDLPDFDYLDVPSSIRSWPVIREGVDAAHLPAEFLYEGRHSGQGQQVDWARAARIAGRGRMILAGGLNHDNVAQAIRQVSPFGVDVSSAVEFEPGKKDPTKIRAFIDAAKSVKRE